MKERFCVGPNHAYIIVLINFLYRKWDSDTTELKKCVPHLANFESLKQHFEWLIDGEISEKVRTNFPETAEKLVVYLR